MREKVKFWIFCKVFSFAKLTTTPAVRRRWRKFAGMWTSCSVCSVMEGGSNSYEHKVQTWTHCRCYPGEGKHDMPKSAQHQKQIGAHPCAPPLTSGETSRSGLLQLLLKKHTQATQTLQNMRRRRTFEFKRACTLSRHKESHHITISWREKYFHYVRVRRKSDELMAGLNVLRQAVSSHFVARSCRHWRCRWMFKNFPTKTRSWCCAWEYQKLFQQERPFKFP